MGLTAVVWVCNNPRRVTVCTPKFGCDRDGTRTDRRLAMALRRAAHMTIPEVDAQLATWREHVLTAQGEPERDLARLEIDWLLELRWSLTKEEAA